MIAMQGLLDLAPRYKEEGVAPSASAGTPSPRRFRR